MQDFRIIGFPIYTQTDITSQNALILLIFGHCCHSVNGVFLNWNERYLNNDIPPN